jgi:hypothetical protein
MATSTPGISAPKWTIESAGLSCIEEFHVRLIHFLVELRPSEQHGDLQYAVKRAPGGFEDGLDVAEALAGLLVPCVTDDLVGTSARPQSMWDSDPPPTSYRCAASISALREK